MAKKTQAWFAKRHAAIIWLQKQFPLTFSCGIKPLKIGIHQNILDLNQEGMPAKKWIRFALQYYVQTYTYLTSLKCGAERIDLQGMP